MGACEQSFKCPEYVNMETIEARIIGKRYRGDGCMERLVPSFHPPTEPENISWVKRGSFLYGKGVSDRTPGTRSNPASIKTIV